MAVSAQLAYLRLAWRLALPIARLPACLFQLPDCQLVLDVRHIILGDVLREVRNRDFECDRNTHQAVEPGIALTAFDLANIADVDLSQVRQVILTDREFTSAFFNAPPDRDGSAKRSRNGHASMLLNLRCWHQGYFYPGYIHTILVRSAVIPGRRRTRGKNYDFSLDVVVDATRRGHMWDQKSFSLGDMWITIQEARNYGKSCPQRAPPDGGIRGDNDTGVTTSSCGRVECGSLYVVILSENTK